MGRRSRALWLGLGLLWTSGWMLLATPLTAQQQVALAGSGSSLAAPLIGLWGKTFHQQHPGVQVGYLATSSSEGLEEVSHLRGDFAVGEIALTDQQKGAHLAQIPIAVMTIVPVYNLPGRPQLRFTGDLLAQIYMGHITNWHDLRLARLSPGVPLPNLAITVLQRPEGTGSRYIFAEFLAKSSPEFRKWSRGEKHELREEAVVVRSRGLAAKVAATPGAIGFVDYGVAIQFGLQYGPVENAAGRYVSASMSSINAASAAMQDLVFTEPSEALLNAPGESSYPLTGFAWAYLDARMPEERRNNLFEFVNWCLGEGQNLIPGNGYDRLPKSVATRAQARLSAILR